MTAKDGKDDDQRLLARVLALVVLAGDLIVPLPIVTDGGEVDVSNQVVPGLFLVEDVIRERDLDAVIGKDRWVESCCLRIGLLDDIVGVQPST